MKIGISQLVAGDMPVSEFLQSARNAGYEAVEFSLRAEGDLTPAITEEECAGLRNMAQDSGLSVESLTLNHCTGNLLASGEAWETGIQETVKGLQVAKWLGAPVALHTLGKLTPEICYDTAYRDAVQALKQLAGPAHELGVDIAFEFIWNGFLFSPLEVRNFLDEIGSENVGFYFDPGNMAVFQYPQHWVRILGSRIKRVHLKDWQGKALSGGWTALTEGEVNFPAVMRELKEAGYEGPLISEVAPSLASFEETAEAMKKIAAM